MAEIDLTDVNTSELVQLAQFIGIRVSRALPRAVIIHALENFSPVDYEDPVVVKGKKLSEWLKRYWERIQMQAAKRVCPKCHYCRDAQVLECFHLNRKNFGG